MPGQVRAVNVEAGSSVEAGQVLIILEAMKMEHRIKAPYAGIVKVVNCRVGTSVQADAVLLELEAINQP
jgi:biotin carboxyl carrier protein